MQLEPEHLSCYGLKAEPNTPLYSRRHTLPGDDLQADMYLETVRFLEVHGYGQYEISNFARPGKFSRTIGSIGPWANISAMAPARIPISRAGAGHGTGIWIAGFPGSSSAPRTPALPDRSVRENG